MMQYIIDNFPMLCHSVVYWILIGTLAVGVLYVFARWIKKASRRNDAAFIQTIIEEVATWLDSQSLMNKEKAQAGLQSVFNGEPANSFREQLLRFECLFVQESPSICKMTTTMVFKKDTDIRETTFTRTVDWDTLPGDIRKEFIMNNQKEITYDFLMKKQRT